MNFRKLFSTLAGFTVLFLLYHGAEYLIVFRNSATGFLVCHALFIAAAYAIGRMQFKQGWEAWGLQFNRKTLPQMGLGLLAGIALYGTTYVLSLVFGMEHWPGIPSIERVSGALSLFVFGNFFSSFAEDLLTRAYVYRHANGTLPIPILVAVSAGVYVLNHIYRLGEGPGTYGYLFLLGLLYMIPLVKSRQLWLTGAMHWGGNCTFYFTHEIIETTQTPGSFSPNLLLSGLAVLWIFLFSICLPGLPKRPLNPA